MHYANGREAKNGDQVLVVRLQDAFTGILHGATPGNDSCNGSVRLMNGNDYGVDLRECLHVSDVRAAMTTISDSTQSKPEPAKP